jgi:dolichol-phosphate mannosyltransferase
MTQVAAAPPVPQIAPQPGAETAPEISIVLPALNEAANLPAMFERLAGVLRDVAYEVIVVDDGSTDATLATVKRRAAGDAAVRYVSFTRNFGHQQALRAGLRYSRGRAVVMMDADLQHPPELITQLAAKWREGYDVAATRRADSQGAGAVKSATSRWFYALITRIGDVEIEAGSADFVLMDRRVVDAINAIEDQDIFIRGLLPWLGFKTAKIDYVPAARLHGATKYSLKRMVEFAIAGIVAHSIRPLRLSIYLALLSAAFGGILVVYSIVSFLFVESTVHGWTSMVSAIAILGAAQLLVLGIIGEYVGQILRETRRRPAYVVRDTNCAPPPAA